MHGIVPAQKNAVLIGRNTWESIPEKNRPLPGRVNVILSRKMQIDPEGALVAQHMDQAIGILATYSEPIETIWNIGGSHIYKSAAALSSSGSFLSLASNLVISGRACRIRICIGSTSRRSRTNSTATLSSPQLIWPSLRRWHWMATPQTGPSTKRAWSTTTKYTRKSPLRWS